MRTSLLTLAALTVICAATLTGQAKPNFSGEWVMVPAKSDFGPMPAPEKMTRTITHKDPALTITTVQSGGATGDRVFETTFSTDGKPTKNTIVDSPMTTTGKWDGADIILSSVLTVQGAPTPVEDRFSLSDAGKTLTVTRKVTTPDGIINTKVVMTKK